MPGQGNRPLPYHHPLRKELQCYPKDLGTGSLKVLVAVCNLALVTSEGSGSTPTAPPVCPEGKKQGVLPVGRRVGKIVPSSGGYNPDFLQLGSEASSWEFKNANLKMHLNMFWAICIALSPTRNFKVLECVFLSKPWLWGQAVQFWWSWEIEGRGSQIPSGHKAWTWLLRSSGTKERGKLRHNMTALI